MLDRISAEPILLLHTFDSLIGRVISSPVFYRPHGESFIVAAINESPGQKPAWYQNLKVDPMVEIELNGMTRLAWASTPVGRQRAAIWPQVRSLGCDAPSVIPRPISGVVLTPVESNNSKEHWG